MARKIGRVPIRTKTTVQHVHGGTQNIMHAVRRNAGALAYNYAQRVESGAKRRVHVITGRLKGSIVRTRLGPYHHRVTVGAYYGVYEEYGTRYRPPHPYFRPAITEARARYEIDKRKVFRP